MFVGPLSPTLSLRPAFRPLAFGQTQVSPQVSEDTVAALKRLQAQQPRLLQSAMKASKFVESGMKVPNHPYRTKRVELSTLGDDRLQVRFVDGNEVGAIDYQISSQGEVSKFRSYYDARPDEAQAVTPADLATLTLLPNRVKAAKA